MSFTTPNSRCTTRGTRRTRIQRRRRTSLGKLIHRKVFAIHGVAKICTLIIMTMSSPNYFRKIASLLTWNPSDTHISRPIPLTIPNDSLIGSHSSAQLHIKLSVTVGRSTFTPKLLLLLQRSPPHLIHPSLDRHHLPPERYPDPISRFAIIHFPDRQTDRQMGRWDWRQLCTKNTYGHALWIVKRRAKNTIFTAYSIHLNVL